MVKLLIIADDFTGALDTGVHFAMSGATTKVVIDNQNNLKALDKSVEILVIAAETRHLSEKEAYSLVYKITKEAYESGITYIFKKTDSALRGNIGSELTAVLQASQCSTLHFLPAFPDMKRITKAGVLYIEGIPVHKSIFGKDLFQPVIYSYIPDIIKSQSSIDVMVSGEEEVKEIKGKRMIIHNAETDEDMTKIVTALGQKKQLHLIAGCAGLAKVLPKILDFNFKSQDSLKLDTRMLIACGSINPITRAQLDYAQDNGFMRVRLTPQQKLKEGYFESDKGKQELQKWQKLCLKEEKFILDTNDLPNSNDTLIYAQEQDIPLEVMRRRISKTFGYILKKIITAGIESTILVTGGDSLLGFMKQIGIYEITPIYEIAPGIVVSQFYLKGRHLNIITKSGGFGEESLIGDLVNSIQSMQRGHENAKEI